MNSKLFSVIVMLAIGLAAAPRGADAQACAQADIMLMVGKYHLSLNDKTPICVSVPGTFTIRIQNPPNSGVSVGVGDVTAKGKSTAGLTIEGKNDPTVNKLRVTVEGEAEVDDEYEFLIKVAGVGLLDPTVRVIPSNQYNVLKIEAVNDLLDTLDLTTEDYLHLDKEFNVQ